MKQIALIVLLMSGFRFYSQTKLSTDTIGAHSLSGNIYNTGLFSDSLSSSFCIIIKKEVKAHRHRQHSEHVYVIEGRGQMRLGDRSFEIRKGDLLFIPCNTVHAVTNLGPAPLKVLSIQSPRFDGSDRIWE